MSKPPIWYACLISPPHREGAFTILPLETYLNARQYKGERSLAKLAKAIAYSLCHQPHERDIVPWLVTKNAAPTPIKGWGDICILPTEQNKMKLIGVNFIGSRQYQGLNDLVLCELSLIANRPGYLYELIESLYGTCT